MKRTSRSPADDSLVGTILIENIPRRIVSNGDIAAWLKKYGDISEISIYKDCYVVQFESDLQAAGAVQCENGAHFFGVSVSVKHAEPGILSALRRSGPPVNRYVASHRRAQISQSARDRNRDRDRERDRSRFRDRNRERGRTKEPDPSPRSRYHGDSPSYDRRRRHDDRSPRRRSRSPASARDDRRHVHPLNWLSEMAGTDSVGSKSVTGTSPINHTSRKSTPPPPPPPYTVAIVAVQHDLVPYAETIEKRVSGVIRGSGGGDPSVSLKTHIVVLLSVEHLTPCLADLTRDRVPFAIICTTTNWSHGSCTLRILYIPTQQEHRNMPLDDAITLLQKEYDSYLAVTETTTRDSVAMKIDDSGNDHTFLAPSRNIVTLLRMLADSRILSIGELDEIAAFVQERKRRLEGRRTDSSSADSRNGSTSDLKSRILSMLYPPTSNTPAAVLNSAAPPNDQSNPTCSTSLEANSISHLTGVLPNPTIQQAIDTLMMMNPNQLPQPTSVPVSSSISMSTVLHQQNFGKSTTLLSDRVSGSASGSNRILHGPGVGTGKFDRPEALTSHRDEDRMRYGSVLQKNASDYQNSVHIVSGGFPMHKRSQTPQQSPYTTDPHFKASQDSRGSCGGPNRRDSDEAYSATRNTGPGSMRLKDNNFSATMKHGTEDGNALINIAPWQRQQRSKRGGGTRPAGDSNFRGPHGVSNSTTRNPNDLMATSVAPVGALAQVYQYSWAQGYGGQPSGCGPDSTSLYSNASLQTSVPTQYTYPGQSFGSTYPPQQFY